MTESAIEFGVPDIIPVTGEIATMTSVDELFKVIYLLWKLLLNWS